MPRGPSPVVLHLAVVVETFHVAAVTHLRSPSLAAAAARDAALSYAPSPPRLSLLLSLLRKAPPLLACCTYGCRHLCRARTRMREIWCVGGVWRALGEHVLDRFAAASPAALVWPQE